MIARFGVGLSVNANLWRSVGCLHLEKTESGRGNLAASIMTPAASIMTLAANIMTPAASIMTLLFFTPIGKLKRCTNVVQRWFLDVKVSKRCILCQCNEIY